MNQKLAKKLRRDAKLITTQDPKGLPTEEITKQYYDRDTKETTVTVVGRKVVVPKSGTAQHSRNSNRAVYQQIKKLEKTNVK
jgi:hypothetical protein